MIGTPSCLKKKPLLTGAKADVDSYLERWRKVAVNRVYKAFGLVEEVEVEKFGEKSSTVRINDLPPADSDHDPDPVDAGIRDHGFEESGEEEDGGALEGGKWMSILTRVWCVWLTEGRSCTKGFC